MATVVVRHKINDFAKWKEFYDNADEFHKKFGVVGSQVFQSADNPNELVILTEMKSLEDARKFGQSEELKAAMKDAGVADEPHVYFTERVITKKFQ